MAPALTQTEPPNLADTTCHTPDSSSNTPLPYDNLKVLRKIKSPKDSKVFCESEQKLTSNGDCVSPCLAPPACGWAEGRPTPKSSPTERNMDEQLPLPISNCGNTPTSSEQTDSSNSNMGFHTHVTNFEAASSLIGKAAVTVNHEDSNAALGNQSDLLALVGRDFDNVNEIIDTLQRLASNPELLDAAEQELEEPQSSNNSQNAQNRNHTPEDCATTTLNQLCKQQLKLERRRQFLLRRLRRVTARGLGMTISSQINYMTRHIGGLLEEERMKKREKSVKENVEEPIGLEMLHKESMKSMSTSDLISLVRRVEASNNLQRLNDRAKKAMCIPEEVSNIPMPLAAELDTVASEMKGAVLAHVCHDSDATESSSGGESCDESEFFSDANTDYKPIKERAFYKFCRNRGWIASKWIWLQTQIADIDFRILQQQKYYLHLRKTKGMFQLTEEPQHIKNQTPLKRSPAHLEMQDPALTCIGSPGPRTVLNGYHPSTKLEDKNSLNGYANGHQCLNVVGCSRTFGIHKVKRRRYIKPNLLLKRSLEGGSNNSTNKFIKVSPVFCKCVPPVTCVLCVKYRTSNKNYTSNYEHYWTSLSKLEINYAFSFTEKLSKKDPGFHSVLSRISEIQQGDVYSSLLKSSDWQQKYLICKPVTAAYQRDNLSSSSEILEQQIIKKKKKNKEHKRNGRRKHLREDSRDRITLKLKKSLFADALEEENTLREEKSKIEISEIPAGGTMKYLNEEELVDYDNESGSLQVSVSGSANSSPCPSPVFPEKEAKGGQDLKNNKKQSTSSRQKQNSTSSSYDINNIVIPYNMAAASRVELIQYKEIPTPKWRVEEILPLPLSQRNDADLEEIEDISDEAIVIRHRKSEIDEHKKYLHYYNSLSSRSSRVRRADSSGTNTPDHPLSPRPSESLLEGSPVGSPPDTPLTPQYGLSLENPPTVLTLSLSSLKSSLLKSGHQLSLESEELSNSSNCNLSSLKCQPKTLTAPPSSCLLESSEAPLPASRTRRSHSTSITNVAHPLEKPRLSSLNEEQIEKERISPFPCRNFPLKENEYQDLVCINDNDSNNNNDSNTNNNDSGDDEDENSIENCHQSEEGESPCTKNHIDTVVELTEMKSGKINNFFMDEESGRGSPLSELTDSAPEQEEEGSWEEGAASSTPPDWTISAVNDQCGGFVLTVQKN